MSNPSDGEAAIVVGDLVNVESRTWPGINKPGGIGKVSRIHTDESSYATKVDVKYVLGGEEKEIELQYVKKHEDLVRGARARQRREVMNLSRSDGGRPKRTKSSGGTNALDVVEESKMKKRAPIDSASSAKKNKRRKSDKAENKKAKEDIPSSPPSTDVSTGHSESDLDSVVVTDDEGEDAAASRKSIKTKIKASKKPPTKPVKKKETKTSHKQAKSLDREASKSKAKSKKKEEEGTVGIGKAATKEKKRKSLKEVSNEVVPKEKATVLQRVYADNSRAASNFVADVVGQAPLPSSSSCKKDTPSDAHEQDSCSDGGSVDESLSVDVERKQLFVSSLNDIMMKRMVDEMSIDEILAKVNVSLVEEPSASSTAGRSFQVDKIGAQKAFTNLEIRSYLNELDREQKIMVTWDSGTVYRI